MLKIQNVSKNFSRHEAVSDLSLNVARGEVLGLLGPNGAGKTTTLRMAAGLIKPDSGTIMVENHNIQTQAPEAKKLLSFLPDHPSFFSNITCWEHVHFVAKMFELENWEKRAEELFEIFTLTEKKNSFPSELSMGMRQRLGLICAFLHSPKIALFDEPMTGLDPHGIKALNNLIISESKLGTTVILSSHLLSYLEEVCSKIIVMEKGKLVLEGTLSELRSKFSSPGELKTKSLEDIFLEVTKNREAA